MRRFLAAALAACLLGGGARAQEPNLVRNGDFEAGADEAATPSWRVTTLGEVGFFRGHVVKRPHTGKYALVLLSEQTPATLLVYSDVLPLREAEELEVSFFYRTVGNPGAGVALAGVEGDFAGLDPRTPLVQIEMHNLPPSKKWQPACWRVRRSRLAQQCVVLFRIRGEGQLYVDDVRAVAASPEPRCQVVVPGDIVQPPQKRVVRLQMVAPSDGATATANIVVTDDRPRAAKARFDARGRADLTYAVEPDASHEVHVTVVGRDGKTVLYGTTLWPRPALDVQVADPALRGTVFASMRPEAIVARCRVNAVPETSGRFELQATLREDLKGARDVGRAAAVAAAGQVQELTLEGAVPPPGRYWLSVTASLGGRPLWEKAQLLQVLEPRRWEIGYGRDMVTRINGTPVFPVGLGNVFRRASLPEVATGGFNFVMAPRAAVSDDYLTEAHAAGLKVAASAIQTSLSPWQSLLDACAVSPALLGWYALERPESREVQFGLAQQLYTDLAAADPYHPVLVAIGRKEAIERYADASDIVVVAPTPVPAWPMAMVGEYVAAARHAVQDHKPVWACVQTCGHAAYGPRPSTDRLSRPPSREEMRCMVFLALIHGARGICFETYELMSGGAASAFSLPRDCPDLWEAVVDTALQLRELERALVGPFPLPAAADDGAVHAAVLGSQGERLLIAANALPQGVETTIRLPAGVSGTPRVLFDTRPPVAAQAGSVRERFLPLEVRIYRLAG